MFKSNISSTRHRTVKRGGIILTAFLIIATMLLVNIFNLEYFSYIYYKNKVFDQITTSSLLKAERGNIYDTNMNVLATTKTTWRIFISTKEIKSRSKKDGISYAEIVARGLSEVLSLEYDSLYKKISKSNVLDVTIKKSASEEEYKKVLKLIEEKKLEDLIFTEAQTSRYYPGGTLAAHTLGFTGSDNQGLYGLEYYYNSTLAGKDGYYLYAKDAGGNSMPGEYSGIQPSEDGYSIVTTIDSYVQEKLEGILEKVRVTHLVENRVCGIVMDTSTGAILGMATSSPFDPNNPFELDAQSQEKLKNSGLIEGSTEYKALKNELMQTMWSNKAVSETYEPGSTFKIITVSAALDSGACGIDDRHSCIGYHNVGGWRIKCHKVTGHGAGFTLAYGLQMSCNPTMMRVAEKMGAETFYSYVENFGYLEKSGIDLPSEASTIFHNPEAIGPTELATSSFGQRFKVSVINHLRAIAAVANGGYLIEPYVVSKIIDSDGKVISTHQTVVKRQVISTQTATTVASVLEEGVSGEGGAKNAYVDGYAVAAKTGTSQKFDVLDANGNSYLRIGSTVAFAPSNKSGIAVIIVVDEPQSAVKYGSVVAAPYISELLAEILPYLNYESTKESTIATVSDYVGMPVSELTKLLNQDGIKYSIIGNGDQVISQFPLAGIEISKSLSTIYIYTEKRDDEYVSVPSLSGLTIGQANALAYNSGLNLRVEGGISDKCSSLTVSSQSIPYGAKVKRGAVITITVIGLDFED